MAAQMQSASPAPLSDFRKSRLFAEGWKAARGSSKPARNPYSGDPERAHWLDGYTQGRA